MKEVRLKWTFNIYTKKDLNGQKILTLNRNQVSKYFFITEQDEE